MSHRSPSAAGSGPSLASLLAGPIFVFWAELVTLFIGSPDDLIGAEPMLLFAVIWSVPFGFMLSLGPVVGGTWAMGRLGGAYPLANTVGAWIAAGSMSGGLLSVPWSGTVTGFLMMAGTGGSCALLCWRGKD